MASIYLFTRSHEVKREAWHYMIKGGIVKDPFWHRLTDLRDRDAARFDRNHPNIAGYFKPPDVLGNQPHGPILDDLRRRLKDSPETFIPWHPFWAKVLSMETTPPTIVPPIVPPSVPGVILPPPVPGGPAAVPEPDSAIMGLIGYAMVAVMAMTIWAKALSSLATKEGRE